MNACGTEFRRWLLQLPDKIKSRRALQKIRKKLLTEDVDLKCYGAMENVYPSPMMMNTTKAYFLKKGEQAKEKSIVDIFEYTDIKYSTSVEEQNTFYSNWLKSL